MKSLFPLIAEYHPVVWIWHISLYISILLDTLVVSSSGLLQVTLVSTFKYSSLDEHMLYFLRGKHLGMWWLSILVDKSNFRNSATVSSGRWLFRNQETTSHQKPNFPTISSRTPSFQNHKKKMLLKTLGQWYLVLAAPADVTGRRQWHPTPVFLPGESQGRGSLVGCRLWGRTESDTTEAT